MPAIEGLVTGRVEEHELRRSSPSSAEDVHVAQLDGTEDQIGASH